MCELSGRFIHNIWWLSDIKFSNCKIDAAYVTWRHPYGISFDVRGLAGALSSRFTVQIDRERERLSRTLILYGEA